MAVDVSGLSCAEIIEKYAAVVQNAEVCGCDKDCATVLVCETFCCNCHVYVNPGSDAYPYIAALKEAFEKNGVQAAPLPALRLPRAEATRMPRRRHRRRRHPVRESLSELESTTLRARDYLHTCGSIGRSVVYASTNASVTSVDAVHVPAETLTFASLGAVGPASAVGEKMFPLPGKSLGGG
jgi:hypothetical protein